MKHYTTEKSLPRFERARLAVSEIAVQNLWMFPRLRKRIRGYWVDAMHRTQSVETAHVGDVSFSQLDQRNPRLRFHLVFPRTDAQPGSPSESCACAGDRTRCGCGAF